MTLSNIFRAEDVTLSKIGLVEPLTARLFFHFQRVNHHTVNFYHNPFKNDSMICRKRLGLNKNEFKEFDIIHLFQ